MNGLMIGKIVLMVGIIASHSLSLAQNKRFDRSSVYFPLIVIEANSVTKSPGVSISRKERLTRKDTIEVDRGYLLLGHYSGRVLEIIGDSTFTVNALCERLSPSDDEIESTADMSFLLKRDVIAPGIDYSHGGILIESPLIKFLYPFDSRNAFKAGNHTACLWWRPLDRDYDIKKYSISLYSVFDEPLGLIELDTNYLELGMKAIDSKERERFVVVKIHESGNPIYKSNPAAFAFQEARTLNPCNANVPIEYLQVAIDLERHHHYNEALLFYIKAADSSDQAIYQEIRDHFVARKQRWDY